MSHTGPLVVKIVPTVVPVANTMHPYRVILATTGEYALIQKATAVAC